MKVIRTALDGVLIVEPQLFHDGRGYFFEAWNREKYRQAGIDCSFVQDNESRSVYGVIRGLHYQLAPATQAKLIRVISGKVLDVVLDIRKNSPTFGKHLCVELSGEDHRQLFIPRGFAHGFATLSEEAVFQYKCDNFYDPALERGIALDDPALGIEWRIDAEKRIMSAKDRCYPAFADAVYL